MLATVVDVGDGIRELEKGILSGAKDRGTHDRKNRCRMRMD